MTITFLDANVLIAAAIGTGDVARRALSILDDPGRIFASSELVRLETLPKAIFHRQQDSVEFYETYFRNVSVWANNLNAIVSKAFTEAAAHDISPRDALHIAAAVDIGAAELATAEKSTKPMFRTSLLAVHSIQPGAV